MNQFISHVKHVGWPAILHGRAAAQLALQFQLDSSQWWPAEVVRRQQFAQLGIILRHCYETVPFYRERLRQAGLETFESLTEAAWRELPVLTRRDVQLAGASLHSETIPPEHGAVSTNITSGSTGQPVLTLKTELVQFFWRAFTLRDDLWHRRDFSETLAVIRHMTHPDAGPPHGRTSANWGGSTQDILQTGPIAALALQATIEEQCDWLARVQPGYLLTYPSALRGITEQLARQDAKLPHLKGIKTFGEILEADCRDYCEGYWQVPIKDMYSAEEVGYIALECPETNNYHVQAESVLVEVLDDSGRPCGPGEVGRVVVTTLHNFAMPLLRYDIGDFAEVGVTCSCGRGLPVLSRILGRQRNLLVMPDGRRKWPTVDTSRPDEFPQLLQFQLVQRTLEELELRAVRPVPFSAEEVVRVEQFLHRNLGYPFRVTIRYLDAIPRSPSGKFEDFISEIDAEVAPAVAMAVPS